MTDHRPNSTPGGLVAEALTHLSRIIRGEMAMAQAEVTASLRRASFGLVLLVGAVVLAVTALNLLATALVAAAIHAGLSPVWAPVAVGAGFAVLALVCIRVGVNALKPSGFVPVRTLRGLRRDAETLKQGLKQGLEEGLTE